MSETRYVARPAPIHFIGDSHVLIFDNLLYRSDDRYYVTHASYVSSLSAAAFCAGSRVSPAILSILTAYGALMPPNDGAGDPVARPDDPHWRAVIQVRGRALADQTFVFSCGDLDARALLCELGPNASFELPFAAGERIAGSSPVPYALIESRVRASLAPLFGGLKLLRESGLHRLVVPSVPPPMTDELSAVYIRPGLSEELRYAVVRIYNATMETMAGEAGVRFVNIWPQVTRNDRLDPAFDLDGVHLNRTAADLLVRAILTTDAARS